MNVTEMGELKKRDILKKYGREVGTVNKRERESAIFVC